MADEDVVPEDEDDGAEEPTDTPQVEDAADDREDDALRSAVSIMQVNRSVVGELIAHFAHRDVRFVVDGDAALRILALYSGSRDPFLEDHANPAVSSAYSVWLGLDLGSALGLTWTPGVRGGEGRAMIDPVPRVSG